MLYISNMQNKIKEYRTKLKITQEQLANLVDIRRETIIYLEQGKYNPSLELAYLVARNLNTTIDELFVFQEPMTEKEKNDWKSEMVRS